MHKSLRAASFVVAAALLATPIAQAAPTAAAPAVRWVASWASGLQPAKPPVSAPLQVKAQTLRQVIHLSLRGPRARLRLSNAYGTTPLRLGAAHLASHAHAAAIVAGSDRALTFNGARSVTIPAGAQVTSDPVALPAGATNELVVSLFMPDAVTILTEHSAAQATTYVSAAGDVSGAPDFAAGRETHAWYLLAGVDVEAAAAARTIVALGDSLTDGERSTQDANHRWPDFLAARLRARATSAPRAVVNVGINGNGLMREIIGPSMLARFDRDVLAQPGVGYVVLLAGVNDIIQPGSAKDRDVSAAQLIAADQKLVERAHARGLKIMGATLTPFAADGPEDAPFEAKRQALNLWIRAPGHFDAVADFDRATRDPAHPTNLLPALDGGDHLHLNDSGYRALAAAVDLALFD